MATGKEEELGKSLHSTTHGIMHCSGIMHCLRTSAVSHSSPELSTVPGVEELC